MPRPVTDRRVGRRGAAEESLSSDSSPELVAAVGLGVDDAEGDAGSLTVVRGAKGKYCFTLGLPVAVELEDVPEGYITGVPVRVAR
jgi:hypothetical protein